MAEGTSARIEGKDVVFQWLSEPRRRITHNATPTTCSWIGLLRPKMAVIGRNQTGLPGGL
jgi:hypothetical protein